MNRCCTFLVLAISAWLNPAEAKAAQRPNIVLMYADNLGYGDIGCYGSKRHRTPHIDRLAAEGMRFTDFYVSSGVCTPSRASLLTGCYPRRVNLHVSDTGGAVLQPVSPKGLHPDEVTLAELLKFMAKKEASDLHLKPMRPPLLRIKGRLIPLNADALQPKDL